MARIARAWTALEVERLETPGLHAVGAVPGLCLRIAVPPSRAKSWALRFLVNGKRRELGLGGYPEVSLVQAVASARERRLSELGDEGSPMAEPGAPQASRSAAIPPVTFAQAAEAYISMHAAAWKHPLHASQWRRSLELHAYPKIGELDVLSIGITEVLRVLEPIWHAKTETASKVRGRIELILAWAYQRAEAQRLNPARWDGHLDTQLPARGRIAVPRHHAALPVAEMPRFMKALAGVNGGGARALEFAILTAARPGEVRLARWPEIDFASRTWIVPASRMKGGREHRVPLSAAAVSLLESTPLVDDDDVIFQSTQGGGGAVSNMTMLKVCQRMGESCVPHGFRSTFRDWCAEYTDFAPEIAEVALSHAIGNSVEAAYRRGDLLEKRRPLMEAWAAFLESGTGAPAKKLPALIECVGADVPKVAKALTALEVIRLSAPGMHTVGAVPGLYLRVLPPPSASRSWILRIKIAGGRRDIGLGGYPQVSPAQAREAARIKRQMVCDGIDPILEKRAVESARRAATTRKMTFAEAADRYIAIQEPGWRNAKHAWQWRNSLDKYVIPKIGRLDVGDIGITQVLSVLEPIWHTTTETASRVRGRIELILAWADKRVERERLNPARWRGHLDTQLPRPSKVARPKHHKALPVAEMPPFITRLRDQDSMAARALEFAVLTAARSGEVRHATWSELDLTSKVWTIPAERMKGGREHRVPLSDAALALLQTTPQIEGNEVVFQSPRSGPLNDSALLGVCRRIGADCVPHGFRSTFRDWCAEHTNVSREVAEMALAHAIGSEVEAAYRRGDLFEKRRVLMDQWAVFCERDDHRLLGELPPASPPSSRVAGPVLGYRRIDVR